MGGLVKQRMVCTGNFLIVILLFPLLTFNSALSYLLGFFFRFISKYHILLSQITNQKKKKENQYLYFVLKVTTFHNGKSAGNSSAKKENIFL